MRRMGFTSSWTGRRRARLVPIEDGQPYLLKGIATVVGRSHTVDFRLNHHSVSRHHAIISQHADRFEIEDMDSSNGTFVNEKRVDERTTLENGDLIGFGSANFKFQIQSQEEAESEQV